MKTKGEKVGKITLSGDELTKLREPCDGRTKNGTVLTHAQGYVNPVTAEQKKAQYLPMRRGNPWITAGLSPRLSSHSGAEMTVEA